MTGHLDARRAMIAKAIDEVQLTHIVSMVSDGKDSAASHAAAIELGLNIDLVVYGKTGCAPPAKSICLRRCA